MFLLNYIYFFKKIMTTNSKPRASQVAKKKKESPPANAGDARDEGSILRSGRSPGVGNGNPLQYSCLQI